MTQEGFFVKDLAENNCEGVMRAANPRMDGVLVQRLKDEIYQ